MPFNGGLSPSPERCGGGRPTLAFILDSLNVARGSAYDTTWASPVYVENMAFARAITAAWGANRRLSFISDPQRMTASLPRWETILSLTPGPDDTEPERRRAVQVVWSRFGTTPTPQHITDVLADALGANFVGLTHTPSASATVFWPGGTTNPSAPWYSTVANIMVQVVQTTHQSDAEFYAVVGQVFALLDPIMPAWTTFDWYRVSLSHGAGFWLDETNLDNEAFD